ncbi:MAG: ribosome small subunit-dependent GTPase A [Bacteroidales bacterium]|jgi:ribosome biogenesis GTPase|nr:ribosome small subunit-dependent GTPase A [Bacteroidales bacterium]
MSKKEGLVIKSTGSSYLIRTNDARIVECKLRGKFRMQNIKTTNPVTVGDNVLFTQEDQQNYGIITDIKERKNYISRKSINLSKISHIIASNIDCVFLMISLKNPRTPLGFMDRFLVAAESFRIKTILLFNKTDLYDSKNLKEQRQLQEIYTPIGYECISTSAITKEGIDELKLKMKDKVSLFGGQSGVGKSSIINVLDATLQLKIGNISNYNNKGKHTTTFAEMFELSFGGFIIDTPGIKEFGLIQYRKEEISHYFPEMLELLPECRFSNCTHTHEPHCRVKQALEEGTIAPSRYQNYLDIIQNEDVNLKDWMLE